MIRQTVLMQQTAFAKFNVKDIINIYGHTGVTIYKVNFVRFSPSEPLYIIYNKRIL